VVDRDLEKSRSLALCAVECGSMCGCSIHRIGRVAMRRSLNPNVWYRQRWAELLATLRTEGRAMPIKDSLIAATALAHDLFVWTQDGDFDVLAELAPALRVHRG
jgi:hypothetical protein